MKTVNVCVASAYKISQVQVCRTKAAFVYGPFHIVADFSQTACGPIWKAHCGFCAETEQARDLSFARVHQVQDKPFEF